MPVVLYSGEWDQGDGPLSVKSWLKDSKYLTNEIWEAPRKIYYVNSTTGMQVGGYWRADTQNLVSLLTVPKMGHSSLRTEDFILKQVIRDYLPEEGESQ